MPIGDPVGIDCALIPYSQWVPANRSIRAGKSEAALEKATEPYVRLSNVFLQNLNHHHGQVVHLLLCARERRDGFGDLADQRRGWFCFFAAHDIFQTRDGKFITILILLLGDAIGKQGQDVSLLEWNEGIRKPCPGQYPHDWSACL
jgi:hypothetical protein